MKLNAYRIDAGEQNCVVDNLGEIGVIHENIPIINVVYAETRTQAKSLFVEYQERHHWLDLEWTYPMSIRLLAKNVECSKPECTEDFEGFFDGELTSLGQHYYAEYQKYLAYIAEEEKRHATTI